MTLGALILMAVIRLLLTPPSTAELERMIHAPQVFVGNVEHALTRSLVSLENELKVNLLRGGNPGEKRNGKLPLAARSTALLQAIHHELDGPFSGTYGAAQGPASAYARTILDAGVTTITPKNAKHLWIPVGENLTKSGQMRMSPREAFEQKGPRGGTMLSIFKSKRGNLVAFLRDPKGGTYTKGKNKGRQRGKLLFVLKDEVQVEGTDALNVAYLNREGHIDGLFDQALQLAIAGEVFNANT
ncbi:MAG: hypothetical protein AAGA29_05905 [Planctomycetota bacterium]